MHSKYSREHNADEQSPSTWREMKFIALFTKYENFLFQLAFKLMKNRESSRDIVQEVFITVWNNSEKLDNIENEEAYLYTLTRNKIIDFLRRAAYDQRLKAEIWKNCSSPTHSTQPIIFREYQQIIEQAIALLPPKRREIYLLKDMGYKNEEIAQELKISPHTVRNQFAEAILFVRNYFLRKFK